MKAPATGHRRRRKRLVLLGTLALVAAGAFIAYRVLTEPARVRRLAEQLLRRVCTTDATLGSASFSLFGGLRVGDLVVPAPSDDPDEPPVLTCGAVNLAIDFGALLSGEVRVAAITAEDVRARAVFDPDTGRFDIQEAFRLPERRKQEPVAELPTIDIDEVQVRLYYRTPERLTPVDSLRVNVKGRGVGGDLYRLTWMSRQARRDASGSIEVDVARQEIREATGGSPWFSLDTVQMVLSAAAPDVHRALQEYSLAGQVRTQGWTLRWGADGALTALNLEMADLAASIPLDEFERPLPGRERYVRFDQGAAKVALGDGRATLQLEARFHGSPLRVRATAAGPLPPAGGLDQLDIDVRGSLRDWQFPQRGRGAPEAQTRFVNRWKRLRYFYNDFDPHGAADLDVHVVHAPDGGWDLARAELRPRGLDAMHRSFPYRVRDLTGLVELDAEGIHLRGLVGRHDEGEIRADGWLEGPGPAATAEVYLEGDTIALDEALCDALPERYGAAWKKLEPTGYADVFVRLRRPGGGPDPTKWSNEVSAYLRGTDLVYDEFPYPVRDLVGPIVVDGDTLRINGLRGLAGAGPIAISGTVSMSSGGVSGLDLRLAAGEVPLDDRLRTALAPTARSRLQALAAAGGAGVEAHLTWNPEADAVDYDVNVDLDRVHVRPAELPVPVENLTGQVRLQPNAVELTRVSGTVGGGQVELAGRLEDLDTRPCGDVEVRIAGLHLDDTVRAGLPEAARAALADWQIDGPVRLEGRWRRDPQAAGAGHLQARLPLDGLRVRHTGFPIPIDVAAGTVTVDGPHLALQGVRGTADGAQVAVAGHVGWGDAVRVELDFTAADVRFTPALRDASPWRVQRLWNNVEPAGAVRIRRGKIGYFRPAGGGPPEWTVDGELDFTGAAFDVGPQLTGLTGSTSFAGQGQGSLGDIGLRGTLLAAEVTVGGWPLEALQGSFARDGQTGRWDFPDFQGRLFGGALRARLDVTPQAHDSTYELTATVDGARMSDLAAAWGSETGSSQETAGVLSGRFYLTGHTADEAGRQGGGRVYLRDARLYKLPLLLSVINVINFAKPEDSVFREGHAEFYLVGPKLEVRSMLLKGPALALSGDGSMDLPSKELDLRLIVTNPHEWARVPVVTEIVEGAVRELMEVHVTGTPSKPKAAAKPLHRVEGAVETLLSPLLSGRD